MKTIKTRVTLALATQNVWFCTILPSSTQLLCVYKYEITGNHSINK